VKKAKWPRSAKTTRALSRDLAAPTLETLKQVTPPASRGGTETVSHALARPYGTALRAAAETLKQRQKVQAC